MITLVRAAHESAAQLRADRKPAARSGPSQRRNSETSTAPPRGLAILRSVELRDSTAKSGALDFEGLASATSAPYEMWDWAGPYTEIVTPGAFAGTLSQPDLDVPLVLNHDSLRRIARTTLGTLQLAETDDGLMVRAPELDPNDPDVAYIAPKLRSGLVDEMSFRFTITSGQWSPDFMEYHIEAVDIHRGDVAIVGYGANPSTVATLREQLRTAKLMNLRTANDAADGSVITQAMAWFTAVDSIVDEAQEALAAYLGVPSPDPDDADDMPMDGASALAQTPKGSARRIVVDEDEVRVRSSRSRV